jgi:hypothetical protein
LRVLLFFFRDGRASEVPSPSRLSDGAGGELVELLVLRRPGMGGGAASGLSRVEALRGALGGGAGVGVRGLDGCGRPLSKEAR